MPEPLLAGLTGNIDIVEHRPDAVSMRRVVELDLGHKAMVNGYRITETSLRILDK